ncbi:MAG: sulfate ABC transporter permease subunit CysT [Oscillatoriales cyanobacterium SM2_2_1]|nr:sulfate ABC transporter permease subunit CysT [Oscillatoriales cyanobacterium SM2_2_1]
MTLAPIRSLIHSFPRLIGKTSIPFVVAFSYLAIMLLVPTVAIFQKALTEEWSDIWRIATDSVAVSAYEVTFVTALVASLINGLFGTLLAWVLIRHDFPLRRVFDALIDIPFALPTAVAGLTLSTVYSPNGWIGGFFPDVKISFSRIGVGIAMIFISLPFVVRTVQPVLMDLEKEIEEAAACLGANRFQIFFRVIFPTILPAVLTGIALGFSRAVGEYGSTVIIASNLPYNDLIAPVLIIQRLEQYDYAGATVIGLVLLLFSFATLIAINFLQVWGRRYEE